MTQSTRLRLSSRPFCRLSLLLTVGALLTACGLYGIEPPHRTEVGQAVLQITAVPEDVKCLRITATGPGRTEERELDVTATGDLAETLTGLPIGSVVFKGEAFTGACTAVSKTTIAGWASEPVTASIALGRLSTVTLSMVRNGRAKVDVNFQDEAACTATGAACRLASECCTRHCTGGVCALAADAGRD
jgi:hypothetical protein